MAVICFRVRGVMKPSENYTKTTGPFFMKLGGSVYVWSNCETIQIWTGPNHIEGPRATQTRLAIHLHWDSPSLSLKQPYLGIGMMTNDECSDTRQMRTEPQNTFMGADLFLRAPFLIVLYFMSGTAVIHNRQKKDYSRLYLSYCYCNMQMWFNLKMK